MWNDPNSSTNNSMRAEKKLRLSSKFNAVFAIPHALEKAFIYITTSKFVAHRWKILIKFISHEHFYFEVDAFEIKKTSLFFSNNISKIVLLTNQGFQHVFLLL